MNTVDVLQLVKEASESWISQLPESSSDYSLAVINYVIDQRDVSVIALFMKQVRGFLPSKIRENAMSIAEKLKDWGRQEGRQEEQKETKRFVLTLLKNLDNDKSKVIQLTGMSATKVDALLKSPE